MDVLKFKDWSSLSFTEEFFKILGDNFLTESEKNNSDRFKIATDFIKKMKFKSDIYKIFAPIFDTSALLVEHLLNNSNFNIEITPTIIPLVTLSTLCITYIEENKNKMSADDYNLLKIESKSILEENKLTGVGNGVIKELVSAFKSIGGLMNTINKKRNKKGNGFFTIIDDIKCGQSILNTIDYLVKKYKMNSTDLVNKIKSISGNMSSKDIKNNLNYFLSQIKNEPANKDIKPNDAIKGDLITED